MRAIGAPAKRAQNVRSVYFWKIQIEEQEIRKWNVLSHPCDVVQRVVAVVDDLQRMFNAVLLQ
jgi:hypothetical protein